MRAIPYLWPLLILACDGGGSSSSSGSRDPKADDDDCHFTSTISGGLEYSFTGAGAVCAYTSGGVSLAEHDGDKTVAVIQFSKLEALQTGSTPATIEIRRGDDGWYGAKCTLDVESNVKVSGSDAGAGTFDNYLIKGRGSCESQAIFRGDGGTKPPVAISEFTFALRTLFY